MKRLFCAVHIKANQQILEVFQSLREGLSHERIRWVQPQNLHLTLKFFGDTPPEKEEQIKKVLSMKLFGDTPAPFPHDGTGEKPGPFSLEIRGCGVFGPARSPRVIWLGVEDGGRLRRLVLRINKALEPLGILADKKAFTPHLTVGRIKQLNEPGRLKEVLAAYKDTSFGVFSIRELKLYQSILRPEGPQYKCLQCVKWG